MQTISVAARLNTPVCDCTGFYHHLNNNRAQKLRDALTHRVVANVWNLSLWKELCTKKVMWCYLSGDTCRSAEYCSVFLRFSGRYRWLICVMMVQLHSASHLKKKDSNTTVVFIIWMGEIPSQSVGDIPGCVWERWMPWLCHTWKAELVLLDYSPSPEATGFLQTQTQIIFAGPPITFQRALSIAWWNCAVTVFSVFSISCFQSLYTYSVNLVCISNNKSGSFPVVSQWVSQWHSSVTVLFTMFLDRTKLY